MHSKGLPTLSTIVFTACALAAAPVSAQAIQVTLSSFGERTSPDLAALGSITAQPVSRAECEADVMADFRFSGIDSTRARLHLFHGLNCDMASVRNDTTEEICTDLMLDYAIEMSTQIDVAIPISSLIDCSGSAGARNIYVLALDDETSEVSGAGQLGMFPIAFDLVNRPSTPEALAVEADDAHMTLTWTEPRVHDGSYEVFFVPDGCDAEGLVTARLTDPPDLADRLPVTIPADGTSAAVIAFPDSVEPGQWNAVALRAVDAAGNEGALSNVACVQRPDCASSPAATVCGSGGCAAGSGRPPPRGIVLALLFLGAFVYRTRRVA